MNKTILYNNVRNLFIRRKSKEELYKYWKKQDNNSSINSPLSYTKLGHKRSKILIDLINKINNGNKNVNIFEIGCNVGRNLNYLFEDGYINLTATEINTTAITLMKKVYPKLTRHSKVYNNLIEDIIKKMEDKKFDVVFSMAVLQHVHKDSEWIFKEMVRITSKYIITIEDESGASERHFPRNYRKIFENLGMAEIIRLKPIKELNYIQFRVFEKNKNLTIS